MCHFVLESHELSFCLSLFQWSYWEFNQTYSAFLSYFSKKLSFSSYRQSFCKSSIHWRLDLWRNLLQPMHWIFEPWLRYYCLVRVFWLLRYYFSSSYELALTDSLQRMRWKEINQTSLYLVSQPRHLHLLEPMQIDPVNLLICCFWKDPCFISIPQAAKQCQIPSFEWDFILSLAMLCTLLR